MSTCTNIHWAESITFERIQFKDFWTHRFTVITRDGTRHEFDAFSRERMELDMPPDDKAHELKQAEQAQEVTA